MWRTGAMSANSLTQNTFQVSKVLLSLKLSLLEAECIWISFFNPSGTLWCLIGVFSPFTFSVIIGEDIVLPFPLLYSGCSVSPLFLLPCVSICHFKLVNFYDVFFNFLFVDVLRLYSRFIVTMNYYEMSYRWNSPFPTHSILFSFVYTIVSSSLFAF